jgi:hypothetical protein
VREQIENRYENADTKLTNVTYLECSARSNAGLEEAATIALCCISRMLHYAMPCYSMLCYAMLCCAMLCYAVLCYAVLCYAMLCYAMLCYAMLSYVLLCCARRRSAASIACAIWCLTARASARHGCAIAASSASIAWHSVA